MNEGLLWVNKDATSASLSRSSKAETARIRAHVQHLKIKSRIRQKPAVQRSTSSSQERTIKDEEEKPKIALTETPQSQSQLHSQTLPTTKDPQPLFANQLSWLPASTADEKRAFLFFLKRTAQEWSGWRDVSFWCRLVPQASNSHDAIFHSVSALGALHEYLEVDGDPQRELALQQLSLRQCNKAAVAANNGPISYTVALMSCIIMICLQNLQSNPVAFQMLRAGANLVNDIEEKLRAGTIVLTRTEMSLLEDYLKPILERLGTRYCFLVDLPSAFALHVAFKQQQITPEMLPVPDPPSKFSTLLEARNALEKIASWAVINQTAWSEQTGVYCTNPSYVVSLLQQWSILLEEVPSATVKEHPGLQSSKILLKAAGLVTEILFDTLGLIDECVYDKHLAKFQEIVRIYDMVSQISRISHRQKISFGIDTGVLHTLAFVVGRCRDPVTRRAALELLERDDHVEGDMRASTGSNVLKRLIELEEKGLQVRSQSDIPDNRRVRIWEDHQYWHDGIVKIFFVRTPYDPERGAVFQEEWTPMPIRLQEEQGFGSPGSMPRTRDHPNVVYGRGKAAFLDENSMTYHTITLSSFFLPIPRM